jgi:hypothetical protein
MEIDEINNIKQSIASLGNTDLSFLISENNGSNIIQRITAKELIDIIQSIKFCFTESINKNLLFSFSRYFIRKEDNSNGDILSTLEQLNQSIINKDLGAIEQWTLQSQNYIYQTGLIILYFSLEKPNSLLEIKQLRQENTALNKFLVESKAKSNELISELEVKKSELVNFKEEKERELTQINNNFNSTNNTKQQIDNLHGEVLTVKSNIDKIVAEVNESYKTYNTDYDGLKNKFEKVNEEIASTKKDTDSLLTNNQALDISLKRLDGEAKRINTELSELLNPAIAKNLQETFRLRKEWLFKTTIFWIILSLIISGILAFYIYEIFNSKEFSFEIEKVIVSAIKLIPIVTFLYFSLKQFSKARDLEEEYAFRESISTSLMAYAEQINDDPTKKIELISQTVAKLYESPTKEIPSDNSLFSKKNNNITELTSLIKELKEAVK